MNKRLVLLIGSFLSFLFLFLVYHRIYLDSTVVGAMMSEEKRIHLEESLNYNPDLQYQLLFREYEVPHEVSSDTYYLPQNSKDITEWYGGFSLLNQEQQLYWCDDEMWATMDDAISQGHAFIFYVVNENEYQTGKIVFTGLPMMALNYTGDLAGGMINCRIDVFDPFHSSNGDYQIIRSYAYHEVRGKTSLVYPKHGYNLKLYTENGEQNKLSLLGMRTDEDWKLNALYSDQSKVREMIAIQLWKEIADSTETSYDTGTRQEYIELLINSEYLGLYGLMEPIDYKQLSLDKGRDILYKGVNFINEENRSCSGFDERMEYCGQEIKAGNRQITEELWSPMINYLENVGIPILYQGEENQIDLSAYINQHMNLENLLNLELFLQAIYAEDNAYKNQYTAAVADDSGNYCLWKIPWDLNFSFGDCYSLDEEDLTVFKEETSSKLMKKYMLSETLLHSEDNVWFAEKLNLRWKALRENILNTATVNELAENYLEQLKNSGAFERDSQKWHQGTNASSFDEGMIYFEKRLEYLDSYYENFL